MIYILFPLSLFGQIDTSSAEAILKANDYRVYDAPHWTKFPNPMPWQSLVHSFHQHVQIDYIVNTKELEVLTSDRHIVLRDLKKFYYGYSKDSFESSLRGNYIKIHSAANPYPHHRFYDPALASFALYPNKGEYFGWKYQSIGDGQAAMAVKKLEPNKWHVSYALFMKFNR